MDPKTTWKGLKDMLLARILSMDMLDKPDEIADIAFGLTPFYIHDYSIVIDTRNTSPYDVFHNNTVVYVTMIRRNNRWKPIAVVYNACASCGRMNGLKKCASCHHTFYCSRDCQRADWKKHKAQCKK